MRPFSALTRITLRSRMDLRSYSNMILHRNTSYYTGLNIETVFTYYKSYTLFAEPRKAKFRGLHVEVMGERISLPRVMHEIIPLLTNDTLWSAENIDFCEECIDARVLRTENNACLPFFFGTTWLGKITADSYFHTEYFFHYVLPALEYGYNPKKSSTVLIDRYFLEFCRWPAFSHFLGILNCDPGYREFKKFLERFQPLISIIDKNQCDHKIPYRENHYSFAVQPFPHPRCLMEKFRTFRKKFKLPSGLPTLRQSIKNYDVKYTGNIFVEEMGAALCNIEQERPSEKALPSLGKVIDKGDAEHLKNELPSHRLSKLRPLLVKLTRENGLNPSATLESRIKMIESSIARLTSHCAENGGSSQIIKRSADTIEVPTAIVEKGYTSAIVQRAGSEIQLIVSSP